MGVQRGQLRQRPLRAGVVRPKHVFPDARRLLEIDARLLDLPLLQRLQPRNADNAKPELEETRRSVRMNELQVRRSNCESLLHVLLSDVMDSRH